MRVFGGNTRNRISRGDFYVRMAQNDISLGIETCPRRLPTPSRVWGEPMSGLPTSPESPELRAQKILNYCGDHVSVTDESGKVTYTNPAIESMLGYTSDEYVGLHPIKLIHPDDDQKTRQILAGLLNEPNSVRSFEARFRHKNGEYRWIETKVTNLLHDPDVNGLLSNSRDVTAFKEALEQSETLRHDLAERSAFEQALISSLMDITSSHNVEKVLRHILENAGRVVPSDGGSILLLEDVGGRVAYMRGFVPEAEAFFEDYRFDTTSAKYWDTLNNRNPYLIGDTHKSPNWIALPHTEWIRSSVGIPIEIHGRVMGLLAVDSAKPNHFCQDDLEKLQAFARYAGLALENAYHHRELEDKVGERTAELRAAKERVEAILNNSLDGILLVSPDLRIEQTNEAFRKLVGSCYSDECFGQPLLDFIIANDHARVKAAHAVAAAGQAVTPEVTPEIASEVTPEVTPVEIQMTRLDGSSFEAELSLASFSGRGLVCNIRDISRRKAHERQLRYHASLQQTVTDAVIATDLSLHIQSWNPAAERIYGWRADEVMGKPVNEVFDSRYSDGMSKEIAFRQLLEHGSWTSELIQHHKDGQEIHILASTVLFKDDEGVPFGIVSVNHDISESKRAQLALAEDRNLLRTLIDSLPDYIYVKDLNHRTLLSNIARARSFGMTPEETLGKDDYDLYPPDLAAQFHADEDNLFHAGKPLIDRIERTVGLEQEMIWASTTKVPLRSLGGEIVGLVGVTRDITERKRTEEALEQFAADYADLYNNAPVGYHSLDTNGVFVRINDTELKWLGYSRDEVIGKMHMTDLMTPASGALFREMFPRLKEHGWLKDVEFELVRKDGKAANLLLSTLSIYDEDGNFLHSRGTFYDVSELARTRQALEEALKKEKELSELKSRFVSMASHEYRTPLATILASAETLMHYRDRLSDERITQKLQTIASQVGYMTHMIEEVLELGRMQSGRVEYKPVRADLVGLCETVLDEFRNLPGIKNPLHFSPQRSPVMAYLDRRLTRQLLNNLVENAIKYSPDSTPVEVSLEVEADRVLLRVRDQGMGIPPADIPLLFELFHRATNVGTIPGTGLGLAIAKQAVELHGGDIRVESELGVGSVFTIMLPLLADAEND